MIAIVAAMTRGRVIGIGDSLPWNIPDETRHYRKLVNGKTIILGRKTFEAMKGNLPGLNKIVISRSTVQVEGAELCGTFEEALEKSRAYGSDAFVLGGQSIFELAMPYADMMFISYIKKDYEGDRFFPEIDPADWNVESRQDFAEFEYVVYSRKR